MQVQGCSSRHIAFRAIKMHLFSILFNAIISHAWGTQLVMRTSCSHVYLMCTSCVPHVVMCTSCVPHVVMCTSCTSCVPHAYLMCTSCVPHVYLMCTSGSHVYLMCALCSHVKSCAPHVVIIDQAWRDQLLQPWRDQGYPCCSHGVTKATPAAAMA